MHHRLMLCTNCDLIYADPVPTHSALIEEYDKSSFDSQEEAGFAARTYISYLPNMPIDHVLDIGTGGGEFLGELKAKGARVIAGAEPSSAAIATAAPAVKPFIRHGYFDASHYEEASFDLISCFQTLEHVSEPLQISRDVYHLLKPGASYYTVAHDFRGGINKILKTSSPIYDIEHLQLFSKKSLAAMLKQAGFEEIRIFTIWNTYPLYYWLRLLPIPSGLKGTITRFLKAIKLASIPIPLPVGNMAAIAVKPVKG